MAGEALSAGRAGPAHPLTSLVEVLWAPDEMHGTSARVGRSGAEGVGCLPAGSGFHVFSSQEADLAVAHFSAFDRWRSSPDEVPGTSAVALGHVGGALRTAFELTAPRGAEMLPVAARLEKWLDR